MKRLSERQWKSILLLTPIPCVDVIVQPGARILLGFRVIQPLRNRWALLGGKHGRGSIFSVVRRQLREVGITAKIIGFVDVFPVMHACIY
jgi:ADP-ribose pyrophosphatase YjhB (NUDIX family)